MDPKARDRRLRGLGPEPVGGGAPPVSVTGARPTPALAAQLGPTATPTTAAVLAAFAYWIPEHEAETEEESAAEPITVLVMGRRNGGPPVTGQHPGVPGRAAFRCRRAARPAARRPAAPGLLAGRGPGLPIERIVNDVSREQWVAFGVLVATIVGTGVGVCALVLTLHGNIREDLRAVQDRIQGLDDRVRAVEIAIAGGGQNQAGGGGSVAVTPGND